MSRAIVIGGSVAGLLAARVLADHFDNVTIIERDVYPEKAEFRNGVPQSRHLHILLAKGREILAEFFPTFEEDFSELGVPSLDVGRDFAFRSAGGWGKRVETGIITNPVSRVTIDWYVRQQLLKRNNITLVPQTEVQSLVVEADVVVGLNVESRADHTTQTLTADLVVDASGRSSDAPEWLAEAGYPTPPQTIVNSFLGYATRWYKIPEGWDADWRLILISANKETGNYRAGAIQEVEGGQWVVTLAGINKVYPPTEAEGFLEFARQMPDDAIYRVIKDAEPTSPIYGYRRTENIWNHYEKLDRHPEHFIVIGDAYCGFNPVYGQGMTVAAMEAQKLNEVLRRRGPQQLQGLPAEFYPLLAGIIQDPWLLATGEDLRYPDTEGDRPGGLTRIIQKYVDRVLISSAMDADVARAFIQVNNLIASPTILFQPSIMLKVLRHTLAGVEQDPQLNAPVIPPIKTAVGD